MNIKHIFIILLLYPLLITGCSDGNFLDITNGNLPFLNKNSPEIKIIPVVAAFSENEGAGSFKVVLGSMPNGEVAIDVSSSDINEVIVDEALDNILTFSFTSRNWDKEKSISLRGYNDDIADGNKNINIRISINSSLTNDTTGYADLNPVIFPVLVQDDDIPGINIISGTSTFSENSGAGSFRVILNKAPNGDVVIDVSSNDTNEVVIDNAVNDILKLTFTTNDWEAAQTVNLTGFNDDIADGDQNIDISLSVNTGLTVDTTGYTDLDAVMVPVIVQDDDSAGIIINPVTTTFSENSGVGSFSVALNSEPAGKVVIDMFSTDVSKAIVTGSYILSFTHDNWKSVQTVNLAGVNDNIDDGDQLTAIILEINKSQTSDTAYDSLEPGKVLLIVQDDDDVEKTWVQDAYLKASNSGPSDTFGLSVAAYDDFVVVGSYVECGNSTKITNIDGQTDGTDDSMHDGSGAAYVFKKDNAGNWIQDAYLKASNNGQGDLFGSHVAISGDIIAVGAYWEDSNATVIENEDGLTDGTDDTLHDSSGAVYVFKKDSAGNWVQDAYLKASNSGASDVFGNALAVSGDLIVVGAFGESSDATVITNEDGHPFISESNDKEDSSGAVYVFKKNAAGNWIQDAFLKASNCGYYYTFGNDVAVSGHTVVVGSVSEESLSTSINNNDGEPVVPQEDAHAVGAAYVFKRDLNGNWIQDAYLKASNSEYLDHYGISVAVCGNTIAVGAELEDSNATAITNEDSSTSGGDLSGFENRGAVYVYKRDTNNDWIQDAYLKASNSGKGDRFGNSVDIDGDIIVVGAGWEDGNGASVENTNDQTIGTDDSLHDDSGAVYVFKRNTAGDWFQDAYFKAANNGPEDAFGDSVAVSGDTIVVGACLEDSSAASIDNADRSASSDNSSAKSGAAYIFKVE